MKNTQQYRPTLHRCWFCGSEKLKIGVRVTRQNYNMTTQTYYDIYNASVRCNCCHARGPTVPYRRAYASHNADINTLESNQQNEAAAKQAAADAWNELKGQ